MADRLVVLRLGHVQQIGTPEELHSNPVNYYVADFMGYRNLIDMKAARVTDSAVRLSGAGIDLGGTAFHHDVVPDSDVVVAIRPEDIHIGAGDNSFRTTVEVNEYRGSEYAITAATSTGQLIYLLSPDGCDLGATLTLSVRPERVLVYPKDLELPTVDDSADVVSAETAS